MNENRAYDREIEIDMRKLMKKLPLVCLTAVLCAALAFGGTLLFAAPQYESSVSFYISSNTGDLYASRSLVSSCIVILNARETLSEVIETAELSCDTEELGEMISAEALDATEIFEVTVSCEDPKEAKKIADTIAEVLPKKIGSFIEGISVKMIDPAVLAEKPSGPAYLKIAAIGFAGGFILAAAFFFIRSLPGKES